MGEPLSSQDQGFGSQQHQETLQPFTFGGCGTSSVGGSPLVDHRRDLNEPTKLFTQTLKASQPQNHKLLTMSSAPRLLVAPPALLLDDGGSQESTGEAAMQLEQHHYSDHNTQQKHRVSNRAAGGGSKLHNWILLEKFLLLAGGGALLAFLVDPIMLPAIYGFGMIFLLS
jgi:hypothetical protein